MCVWGGGGKQAFCWQHTLVLSGLPPSRGCVVHKADEASAEGALQGQGPSVFLLACPTVTGHSLQATGSQLLCPGCAGAAHSSGENPALSAGGASRGTRPGGALLFLSGGSPRPC